MFVRLVLAGGLNAGMVAEIKQGYYLVGRDQECQIRPESPSVSDRHCLLQHQDKYFRVFVLDSESPTRVNHKRLAPRKWVRLNHGDMLQVGNVPFLVAITQQDPLLPVGAGIQPSSSPRKKRPQRPSDGVKDFAIRDTAELEVDIAQEQTSQPSRTVEHRAGSAQTSRFGRWKESEKPSKQEQERPARQEPEKAPTDTKANKPPRSSSPDFGHRRADWPLLLACFMVVIAMGAVAYGAYHFLSGSSSDVRVLQEID